MKFAYILSLVSLAAALPSAPVNDAAKELVESEGFPIAETSQLAPAVVTTENGLSGACKAVTVIFARSVTSVSSLLTPTITPVYSYSHGV